MGCAVRHKVCFVVSGALVGNPLLRVGGAVGYGLTGIFVCRSALAREAVCLSINHQLT